MKRLKRRSFWLLFAVTVLAGSLLIVNFSMEKRPLGIPNVNAQSGGMHEDRSFPGDTIYLPQAISFPGDTFLLPRGSSNNVTSTNFAAHPSGTFYIPQIHIFPGNPNDDYYMPGVITMPTASTCTWDCGPTYTTCSSTCGRGGQSTTLMTCAGSLFSNCGGPTPTFTTCSSGIFCDGNPMPTSRTCGIFCDGGPMPTFTTCSGGIFCGGGSYTIRTCIGNCPTKNPPIFPEGITPGWGPYGPKIPGSVVNFPTYISTTSPMTSFNFSY